VITPNILPEGVETAVDTLTVSATDGSGVSSWYRVVINTHLVKATAINVTAEGSNIALKMGGASFDLSKEVSLSPADAWIKTVTYTSNDEDIVAVSENGIASAVGVGKTTITIKTTDGSNLSRDVNVEVMDIVERWDDLNVATWTVTTDQGNGSSNINDGTTGLPEHVLTAASTNTFLALFKPGGSNAGQTAPTLDFKPSFTVDTKTASKFNYFRWHHRGNNHNKQLQAFAVYLHGSNDGTTFTQIMPDEPEAPDYPSLFWIPTPGAAGTEHNRGYVGNNAIAGEYYYIETPEVTYRYVKVEIVVWANNYQTAPTATNYPVYYQHPDYPGNGNNAFGNAIQIGQFGLGHQYWD
jgi:hypothetical protein